MFCIKNVLITVPLKISLVYNVDTIFVIYIPLKMCIQLVLSVV